MANTERMEKETEVKKFFEKSEIYTHSDYNIRIRTEVVHNFINDAQFSSVLDMPCGNGAISINNASAFKQLTLVDFSESMIQLTKQNAEKSNLTSIEVACKNIFDTQFNAEQFELVISLGILAHIDDIDKLLKYLQQITKKGGKIIIQNTSSSHFYGKLIRLYLAVRQLLGKDKYKLNKIPASFIEKHFKSNGFTLKKVYRYNQSFIGFSKLFSNEKKYQLTKKIFGDANQNKNKFLGSDYIYMFVKE